MKQAESKLAVGCKATTSTVAQSKEEKTEWSGRLRKAMAQKEHCLASDDDYHPVSFTRLATRKTVKCGHGMTQCCCYMQGSRRCPLISLLLPRLRKHWSREDKENVNVACFIVTAVAQKHLHRIVASCVTSFQNSSTDSAGLEPSSGPSLIIWILILLPFFLFLF
jgi:hypothetical protein